MFDHEPSGADLLWLVLEEASKGRWDAAREALLVMNNSELSYTQRMAYSLLDECLRERTRRVET